MAAPALLLLPPLSLLVTLTVLPLFSLTLLSVLRVSRKRELPLFIVSTLDEDAEKEVGSCGGAALGAVTKEPEKKTTFCWFSLVVI